MKCTNPNAWICGEPNTAIIAVPPAGGWTHLPTFMKNTDDATAAGNAMTGDPIGMATSCKEANPHTVATIWPATTFHGWENGAAGVPKISTAEAPMEPSTSEKEEPLVKS